MRCSKMQRREEKLLTGVEDTMWTLSSKELRAQREKENERRERKMTWI